MNEQIEKIYGEACIASGHLDEREFLQEFVKLILEECVSAIKHESLKQLDPEFGIIYAKAIVARFGATLNQPFLRVEVKD
jgi:hypothetical protein